jgi:hypothetical protein
MNSGNRHRDRVIAAAQIRPGVLVRELIPSPVTFANRGLDWSKAQSQHGLVFQMMAPGLLRSD